MINEYEEVKYVDELGQPSTAMAIAKKYKVSRFKVRGLFSKYSPEKAYSLISKDQRELNGQREVYALPNGEWSTSQEVADYYQVSRSVVQRAWTKYGKCSVKANTYLMDRFKVNL